MVGRHGRMQRARHILIAAAVSGGMALTASSAMAQTSVQQGYSQPGGVIQQQISPSPAPAPSAPAPTAKVTPSQTVPVAAAKTEAPAKSSGKLPFTGFDIALVLAAAGVLLGLGFALRRVSRPSQAA
jgi:hypothetical protein